MRRYLSITQFWPDKLVTKELKFLRQVLPLREGVDYLLEDKEPTFVLCGHELYEVEPLTDELKFIKRNWDTSD